MRLLRSSLAEAMYARVSPVHNAPVATAVSMTSSNVCSSPKFIGYFDESELAHLLTKCSFLKIETLPILFSLSNGMGIAERNSQRLAKEMEQRRGKRLPRWVRSLLTSLFFPPTTLCFGLLCTNLICSLIF